MVNVVYRGREIAQLPGADPGLPKGLGSQGVAVLLSRGLRVRILARDLLRVRLMRHQHGRDQDAPALPWAAGRAVVVDGVLKGVDHPARPDPVGPTPQRIDRGRCPVREDSAP